MRSMRSGGFFRRLNGAVISEKGRGCGILLGCWLDAGSGMGWRCGGSTGGRDILCLWQGGVGNKEDAGCKAVAGGSGFRTGSETGVVGSAGALSRWVKSSSRLRRILRSSSSKASGGKGGRLLTCNEVAHKVGRDDASPLCVRCWKSSSKLRRILRSSASRLCRLGWVAVELMGLAGKVRVSVDGGSSGRGSSWWVRRRGSSSKPSDEVFATDLSTACSVPRCKSIRVGCEAMGGNAGLEAQVFPSMFEGDTMGLRSGEPSPSAEMAFMVKSENTANPT